MNETSLLNTSKVRWLKSQEIYQILKDPPAGLIVAKIPTRPQNGDIFILDSKTIKRKWKQDGWTYMPRKQGIGFREDNENLRIGGENAITCYYSYIINGLLEGEEKVIVMNRRIYKLFPDGQYFFVHYLKDLAVNPTNGIKDQQSSTHSTNVAFGTQQQVNESGIQANQKQHIQNKNQMGEQGNGFDVEISENEQTKNMCQDGLFQGNHNSTTMSVNSEFDNSKLNNHAYHAQNDFMLINQEDSSYLSNSSSIAAAISAITTVSTSQTQKTNIHKQNQKTNSIFYNNHRINETNSPPSAHCDLKLDHKFSKMDEESQSVCIPPQKNGCYGQFNLKAKITDQSNISNQPLQFNQTDTNNNNKQNINYQNYQFYNGNDQDGESQQKQNSHIEDISPNQQNHIAQNFTLGVQPQVHQESTDFDEWQNIFANNSHNQYHRNSYAATGINKNSQQNIYSNNNINNISDQNHQIMHANHEVGAYQQLETEPNFDEINFYNYTQNDRFSQQYYSQQNLQYTNKNNNHNSTNNNNNNNNINNNNTINNNMNNNNANGNLNGSNGYENIYFDKKLEANTQFQNNQNNLRFYNNRNDNTEQSQHNQKNGYDLENDQHIKMRQLQQKQQEEVQENKSKNQNNGTQLNPPSYSKLQERILELEQRLHKLEFDKKSDYASSQVGLNSSQHSSCLNSSTSNALQNNQGDKSQISSNNNNNNNNNQQSFIPSQQNDNQNNTPSNYSSISYYYQPAPQFYNNQSQVQNHQFQQQSNYGNTQILNKEQALSSDISQPSSAQPPCSNQFQYQSQQNNEHIQNGDTNQQNEKIFNQLEYHQQEDNSQQQNIQNQQNEIQEEGQKQINNNASIKLPQDQLSQQNNQIPPIKITEYSPEWDYIKGGSKMVLCFLPALNNLSEYQKSKFQIGFGSEKVPAYCIQPGVLKCFVPPHEKGLVKLQIYLENQRIDDIEDNASYFEFRNQEKKKKKQAKKVIFNQDDEFYRNEFKVRIIDKLNSIQDFISQTGSKTSSTGNNNNNHQSGQYDSSNQIFDNKLGYTINKQQTEIDVILDTIKNNIENLDKQSFDALLVKILGIADSKLKRNQIKKWLDQIDENGYGLIHYIVILGFDTALTILNEYECSLNLKSRNQITPLQLAFALNQEKIVEILIKSGALGEKMNEQIKGGQIKGDISNLLNFGAIYQSRNILDMLVREVTLHDSINNSSLNDNMSWNDQEEQEDNYLDLKDLCENANEDDLIKNLNAISNQLKDLQKKRRRRRIKRNNKKQGINNQEGEQYSVDEYDDMDDEDDYDEDDDDEDDDDDDDDDMDDDDDYDDDYDDHYRSKQNNKQLSHDNLEKSSKKHKYLRNYSEINKAFKEKQRDNVEFDEKDDEIYKSQNYQCRIKTIQKNVRGWLLRRQYLDIKYATRVLQNYIRQKIAKKHIKPECKSMIKNKLIDWLSIKH